MARRQRARHGEAPPPEALPPTRFDRLLEERQNEPWIPYARELLAENARMLAALQNIRDHEGKVCGEFEVCRHRGCNSSYAAWDIADQALRDVLQLKRSL